MDGGVRNITPLRSAIRSGATEIYVLLTGALPDGLDTKGTLPEKLDSDWTRDRVKVLNRTKDIVLDEVYLDDIRCTLRWNKVVHSICSSDCTDEARVTILEATGCKHEIDLHVLASNVAYEGNDDIDFSGTPRLNAIEHGVEIGEDPNKWVYSSS